MVNQFKNLLDHSTDSMFITNPQGIILYANLQGEKLTGYTNQELIGKKVSDLIPSSDLSRVLQNIQQRINGIPQEKPDETILRHKTGKLIPIEVFSSQTLWNGKTAELAVIRDIKDKIELKTQIEEQKTHYKDNLRRLEQFIDTSRDLFILIDDEFHLLNCNKTALNYIEEDVERAEIIGKSIFDIYPHVQKDDLAQLRKVLAEGNEISYIRKSNVPQESPHVLQVKIFPVRNNLGIIAHDITTIEQIKSKLEKERDTSQKVLDIAGVVIVQLNIHGEVTLINKYGSKLLGFTNEEIIGKPWFEAFLPKRFQKSTKYNFHRLLQGKLKPIEYYENPIRTKSGEERIIAWHNSLVRDPKGKIIGTLSSGSDITEIRNAYNFLQIEKQRLQNIVEATNAGIWEWDLLTDEVIFNERWAEILGYSSVEVGAPHIQTWEKLTHPDDLPKAKRLLERHIQGESPYYECEIRMLHKNGKWIWILDQGRVTHWDEKGQPIKIFGIHTDIHRIKQIQEQLRKNMHLMEISEQYTHAGGWEYKIESDEVYWTDEVYRIFELKQKDKPPNLKRAIDFYSEDGHLKLERAFQKCITAGKKYDLTLPISTEQGNTKWVRTIGVPVYEEGNITRVTGNVMDVTAEVKATHALEESERKFRTIFENSPLGIHMFQLNKKEQLIFIGNNPAAEQILDLDHSNLINKPIVEAFPDLENTDIIAKYTEIARNGGNWQTQHVDYDDGKIKGAFKVYVFQISPGTIVVKFDEISEQLQIKSQLEQNQKKLQAIINSSPDPITTTDLNGTITLCNQAAVKMHRYSSKSDIIGMNALDLIAEQDLPQAKKHLELTLKKGTTTNIHYQLKRNDGTIFPAELSASVIKDQLGKPIGFISLTKDISERIKLEEERLKHQKFEAMSYMASGIAHDFNNALMIIGGNMSLLKTEPLSPTAKEMIEDVEEAIKNARKSTNYLMRYSKEHRPNMQIQSIQSLVQSAVNFVSRGSSCVYTLNIADQIPNVEIDEGQINQVLNNILINAEQAMPQRGNISVSVSVLSASELNGHRFEPQLTIKQDYVMIAIQDEGEGIAPEDRTKIFDPYYTTKEYGTGIGLASSLSIIKKHRGYILYETELGVGTTFYIILPVSRKSKAPAISKESFPSVITSTKTVLIMEDNSQVQRIIERMMKQLHLSATIVGNGEQCLDVFLKALNANHPFDLVILDNIIVGGMGGKETIVKLLEKSPDAKVVISSGNFIDNYEDWGFIGQIQKPYTLKELKRALKALL